MRFKFWSIALAVLIGVPVASCNDSVVTAPLSPLVPGSARMDAVAQSPKAGQVVISQIYGGNGNVYASDYIEIYNRSAAPVTITGWSVQYASATGTGSFGGNGVSTLSGTLASGQYYLIKLRTSATGTAVAADLTGANTDMSGSAGKVVLLDNNAALNCNGANLACSATDLGHIVDLVGYGSTANFFETAPAPTASGTTAELRKNAGQQDTDNNSADFQTGPPAPRNTSTPLNPPTGNTVAATITPGSSTVPVNTPMSYSVSATNSGLPTAISAVTWESTDPTVAPVPTPPGSDPKVANTTAIKKGATSIKATVTTAFGTATATVNLTVVGVPATVTVNPATFSMAINGTKTFAATALDSDGQPAPTNITWSSLDPNIATIDPTSGLATAKAPGTVTIRATTSNNVTGDASLTVTAADNGPIVPTTTFVSEIHYDNNGVDANEAIEIESPNGMSFTGWSLVLYDGTNATPYGTPVALDGTNPPPGITISPATICGNRQVIVVRFPSNGLQNGSQDGTIPQVPDGWALVDNQGHAVEFGSYEGTFVASSGPASGFHSTDIIVQESSATGSFQSLQRAGNGVWFGPRINTMGSCNAATPPAPESIIIKVRGNALPVGFQDQLFIDAASTDSHGNPLTGGVNYSTSDANIVTVDSRGIITAVGNGTAVITATGKTDAAATGTAVVIANTPAVSPTARVGHNTELGTPTDADPSDDFIISRRNYTLSYNANHGDPNWVSWNLDASHKGTAPRCDCMSTDPELVAHGITAYNTADWINGGVWSRGHMSPSADWNVSDADNARTFYLSNMLPQNQTLNAGVWGALEDYLRTQAVGSAEIYIIAGGIFTKNRSGAGIDGLGYMAGTGHILVPDSIFKIAIILPNGGNVGDIHSPSDVTVIATKFPNSGTGTGGTNWQAQAFASTVNEIQKSTGYDFLSAIPADIQCKIEVRDCDPTARISGDVSGITASGVEGQTLHFDASTSTDPDNDQLQYQWSVNGVVAGIGATLDYTFPNDGSYQVKVVVGDGKGGAGIATITATIANVAPVVGAFSGGTVNKGSAFTSNGSFTDPGADSWTATVNYGDQSGTQPLSLSGKTFSLNHTYSVAGTFTVTVTVSDGIASATQTASVTVVNRPPVAGLTGAGLNGGAEALTLSFDASTSSDPDNGDVLSYQWTVNGQVVGIGATLSYAFPDNGNYTVGLLVSDLSGATDSKSATVAITNANPTATFAASPTVAEGSAITLTLSNLADASSVDAAAGFHTSFDCGSGFGAPGTSLTATCSTTDNGTRTVRGRVIDKDGGIGEYSATVNVTNVAPSVTLAGTTPLSIISGGSVSVGGSFTDPGADSPWHSSIDWGNGTTTAGTQTVSGASITGTKTYLAAGTYNVILNVTDKDGGVGASQSITVTVGRRAVTGDANPSSINLNDNGNGDITVRLYGDASVDITTLDVASVKVGTIGVNQDNQGRFDSNFEQGGRRASLKFSRKALIDAGVLTAESTELVLVANLKDGRQIISRVSVDVH